MAQRSRFPTPRLSMASPPQSQSLTLTTVDTGSFQGTPRIARVAWEDEHDIAQSPHTPMVRAMTVSDRSPSAGRVMLTMGWCMPPRRIVDADAFGDSVGCRVQQRPREWSPATSNTTLYLSSRCFLEPRHTPDPTFQFPNVSRTASCRLACALLTLGAAFSSTASRSSMSTPRRPPHRPDTSRGCPTLSPPACPARAGANASPTHNHHQISPAVALATHTLSNVGADRQICCKTYPYRLETG